MSALNSKNHASLSLYSEVLSRNMMNYCKLIGETHCTVFNGIVNKKYIFEQIRHVNEMYWWLEDFIEYIVETRSREVQLNIIDKSVEFRREINEMLIYYINNDYLLPSEKRIVYYFYKDMRRIARKYKRRLLHHSM